MKPLSINNLKTLELNNPVQTNNWSEPIRILMYVSKKPLESFDFSMQKKSKTIK